VPLSDRDYMKNPPPQPRRTWKTGGYNALSINPISVLILINFVSYIATLINSDIIVKLGLIPSLFTTRPWTILTSMFVHSGFWHIFGNMITLFFFGSFLARLVGNGRFLLVYFIGGLAGNALYIWLGQPVSIVIGASGAIYAIAGVLVVMMPTLPVRLYFIIPMPLWVVVLVFFVLWSFIPGVAWQAHVGGLAVGLIAGFFFRRKMVPLVYYR
jgi:membrane associated rhomboid family serine protease